MCGFIGILHKSTPQPIDKIIEQLAHRGPDEKSTFIKRLSRGYFSCAFTRLSIVNHNTQTKINQKDLIILFNGEIWNDKSLIQKLALPIHATEIEIISSAYQNYGYDFASHFDGMFAIAIIDNNKHQIILARDPVGIKPLYFAKLKEGFVFASDIKSIIQTNLIACPKVNYQYLLNHYVFGYSTFQEEFIAEVESVPPSTIIKYDIIQKKESNFSFKFLLNNPNQIDSAASLEQALSNALIKRNSHNNFSPVGLLLSGGMDSSLVALLSKKQGLNNIICFFVGDQQEPDYIWAKKIANFLDFPFVNLPFSPQEVVEDGAKICLHNPGALCGAHIYMAFKKIKHLYPEMKVVLCGEGSDELFGGYEIFSRPFQYIQELTDKIFVSRSKTKMASRFLEQTQSLKNQQEACQFLLRFFRKEQLVQNHLIPFDQYAMAYGIELRVPYLDLNLFHQVCDQSLTDLTLKNKRKFWIRSLLEDNGITDSSFFTRKKIGFPNLVKAYSLEVEKACHFPKKTTNLKFWMLSGLSKNWVQFCGEIFSSQKAHIIDTSLLSLIHHKSFSFPIWQSSKFLLETSKWIISSLHYLFPKSTKIFEKKFSELVEKFAQKEASKHSSLSPFELLLDFFQFCKKQIYSKDRFAKELLEFELHLAFVGKFPNHSGNHSLPSFKIFHYNFLSPSCTKNTRHSTEKLFLVFNSQAKEEKNRILRLSEAAYTLINKNLKKNSLNTKILDTLKELELVQ